MRKPRIYEQVCECGAYPFPHRMFGGRCVGLHIAAENYGKDECSNCTLHDNGYCEVLNEQESTKHCPHVIEFAAYHEIRFYNRRLGKLRL